MANTLHHHRYMRMMMLEWPDFPETQGENYCLETVKLIRTNPQKWLCSLPMVEYAHILEVFTAHHLGGEPWQYVKILYGKMFAPVLRRYYYDLETYRFNRALDMRRYASMEELRPEKPAIVLKGKLAMCTAQTRELLCQICEDYHWMKDLGLHHPKVLWYIEELEKLTKDVEYDQWLAELKKFAEELKDKDVEDYPGVDPEPDEPEPDGPDEGGTDPEEPTPEDPEEPEEEHKCHKKRHCRRHCHRCKRHKK